MLKLEQLNIIYFESTGLSEYQEAVRMCPMHCNPHNLNHDTHAMALANRSSQNRKLCMATTPRKTSMCPVKGKPKTSGLGFKRASQSPKENHAQRPLR